MFVFEPPQNTLFRHTCTCSNNSLIRWYQCSRVKCWWRENSQLTYFKFLLLIFYCYFFGVGFCHIITGYISFDGYLHVLPHLRAIGCIAFYMWKKPVILCFSQKKLNHDPQNYSSWLYMYKYSKFLSFKDWVELFKFRVTVNLYLTSTVPFTTVTLVQSMIWFTVLLLLPGPLKLN